MRCIENHAASTVTEIEKTYHDAQGGAFSVVRIQWHSRGSINPPMDSIKIARHLGCGVSTVQGVVAAS